MQWLPAVAVLGAQAGLVLQQQGSSLAEAAGSCDVQLQANGPALRPSPSPSGSNHPPPPWIPHSYILTSVAPWSPGVSRSAPNLSRLWMSSIMCSSGKARAPSMLSWVMPAG